MGVRVKTCLQVISWLGEALRTRRCGREGVGVSAWGRAPPAPAEEEARTTNYPELSSEPSWHLFLTSCLVSMALHSRLPHTQHLPALFLPLILSCLPLPKTLKQPLLLCFTPVSTPILTSLVRVLPVQCYISSSPSSPSWHLIVLPFPLPFLPQLESHSEGLPHSPG